MIKLDLEGPIITSLLDVDFYKLPMQQVQFFRYPEVTANFELRNRTKDVRLAKIIPEEELRTQLYSAAELRLNHSQLHYLRGTNEYQERMFREEYLQFLKRFSLPSYLLGCNPKLRDGQIALIFAGPWKETTYWETIALSIINELRTRQILKSMSKFERDAVIAEGIRRLVEKVKVLKTRPDITFTDFGTRRRAFKRWQWYVIEVLLNELPGQFLGTSNVEASLQFGTEPKGTSAHEMYMVIACYLRSLMGEDGIRQSHNRVLQDWWEMYGQGLSIALTDTFGTDFFFQNMTAEQARGWKGLRHDSGDPLEFGEKAIRFYQSYGVDPREKLLVFSDGLNIHEILRIADHFKNRIRVTFGWGTNLTNDLGIRPLSLVVKASWACGFNTVKLSDNLAKAMGPDVELYKRIFGYTGTLNKACVY